MTTKTKSAPHSRLELVSAMIEEQGLTKDEWTRLTCLARHFRNGFLGFPAFLENRRAAI